MTAQRLSGRVFLGYLHIHFLSPWGLVCSRKGHFVVGLIEAAVTW